MATRKLRLPDGRYVSDPRATQAWRRLAKQVAREEPICWLGFEGCTRVSTTGDHVVPVADRPDLALDRANVHGACESCNTRRRNLPVSALRLEGSKAHDAPALSVFD